METHPDYRRRGYATALYDIAAFLENTEYALFHQRNNLEWEKILGDEGDSAWPKRYDL